MAWSHRVQHRLDHPTIQGRSGWAEETQHGKENDVGIGED